MSFFIFHSIIGTLLVLCDPSGFMSTMKSMALGGMYLVQQSHIAFPN